MDIPWLQSFQPGDPWPPAVGRTNYWLTAPTEPTQYLAGPIDHRSVTSRSIYNFTTLTTFRSKTPSWACCNRSTNLMVSNPRLFSCRLGVLGGSAIILSHSRSGYQRTGCVNAELLNILHYVTRKREHKCPTPMNLRREVERRQKFKLNSTGHTS